MWVEQQIVKSCILPRDNLYIGPGEYHAQYPASHITSPVMQPPHTADDFHPFRGGSSGSNRIYRGKEKRPYTMSNDFGSLSNSRIEFASIFHDHDQRMAIDPSRRHYISQTPLLPQDDILHARGHDGKKKPVGVIMATQKYERPPTREANPDADPDFNTEVVAPRLRGGVLTKSKRGDCFPPQQDYSIPEHSPVSRQKTPSHKSSFEPKRSHRFPDPLPKMQFDTSCYDKSRKPSPVTLTPSYINKKAKIRVFSGVVLKPRSYQSSFVPSALGQRIKRNSME